MNTRKLEKIKKLVVENGGLTLKSNGEVANLSTGYMVSYLRYEKIVNGIKFIELKSVKRYLKIAKQLNAYVGFWFNDGKVYIDISINAVYKEDALAFAKHEKQKAIFDVSRNETIYLDK